MLLSGDVQSTDMLSVDDVVTLQYSDCDDGVAVINGTMSMTILSVSGDFSGGSVAFSVAITLDDFAVSQDGTTQTANGSMTISLNLPNSGPITMSITTDSLAVSDGVSTDTLQDFSLTQSIDPLTGDYTISAEGMVGGSAFDGQVEFSTSIDLAGTGDGYAATGEILITGDGGATIAMFALDADTVRLEIDYDGDGITDQIVDKTWAELAAA